MKIVRRRPRAKHPQSFIKRIRHRVLDTAKGEWLLVLECGHKLGLLAEYHTTKVVAQWCPECERLLALRKNLFDFNPPKPA